MSCKQNAQNWYKTFFFVVVIIVLILYYERAKLTFIDLAGSERCTTFASPSKTLLGETKNINTSLSALGNVIKALSQNAAHIPFR